MAEWYVNLGNNKVQGPFSSGQLKQFANEQKIKPQTSVRLGKDGQWVEAKKVKGLFQSRELGPAKPVVSKVVATVAEPPVDIPPRPVAVVENRLPCPFCGEEILATAIKCRHCNEFLDGRQSVAPAAPVAAMAPVNVQQVTHVRVEAPRRTSSLGVVSLILGVLAFLFCWIPLIGILTIPLSALGLILAGFGLVFSILRRGSGIGFPIAGGVVCGLALVIGLAQVAIVGTGAAAAADAIEQAEKAQRERQAQGSRP